MDKNIEAIKKLYLVPGDFQIWTWVLTILAVLLLFKGTRRIGGTWFLVVLVCMGVFFGLRKAMGDFAPDPIKTGPPKPAGHQRHR